ncbi:MAG: methionyl-tRNA formyltransferase [Planctomycetota bacterium]
MRLVFAGTGPFGLPTLRSLLASRHDVAGVLTQPDRSGPGRHRHAHPIKETAAAAGVTVLQPANVNRPEPLDELRDLRPEVIVTAAYGQILKQPFLDIARHGAINLHASLLPKYRGAAPIHYAVRAGESKTGITIFRIVPALDAGPMLGVVETPIGPRETTGDLHDRLAEMAVPLTLRVLEELEAGTATEVAQDDAAATFAPSMAKTFGEIDWASSAVAIDRHVRATQPWPTAYTFLSGDAGEPRRVVVLEAEPLDVGASPTGPGEIDVRKAAVFVGTGDGVIRLARVKPAGKPAMTAEEFFRGLSPDRAWRFGPA